MERLTQTQRWVLAGLAAATLVLVALLAALSGDDGDGDASPASMSTTSSAPSPTTESTTASSTSTEPPGATEVDPLSVAFPDPLTSRRFDTPDAVARSYATDVLGFSRLIVDGGTDGSEAEGEVVVGVRSRDDGVVTSIETVLAEDGSWYAIGSSTQDIIVSQPSPGASLATPFDTNGTALAFEGVVDVVVLIQGRDTAVGTGFVTGSGSPPAGPFEGRIFFSPPATPRAGVLVFRTLSAEDGAVEQATSIRVRLTGMTAASTAPVTCGDTEDDDGHLDPDARVVQVFFHCGDDLVDTFPLRRVVPTDEPRVLAATIEALLAGPTESEQDAGFRSPFPVEGASVRSVVIEDGVAVVDLSNEVASLPNTSAIITSLSEQIRRTATQFASVAAVEIRFEDDCQAFATWAQSDTCLLPDPGAE